MRLFGTIMLVLLALAGPAWADEPAECRVVEHLVQNPFPLPRASSTSMIVPNSLMPRSQQTPVSRPAGAAPASDVRRFYTMKSLYRDGPRTLQLGTGSIRQQDGQSSICQDMLGCPAEYHLSQSALRVGTLDQKVTAQ